MLAWIGAGLALQWTVGVVIDAVSGYASLPVPAICTVLAAAIALVAFTVVDRRRD